LAFLFPSFTRSFHDYVSKYCFIKFPQKKVYIERQSLVLESLLNKFYIGRFLILLYRVSTEEI
jgi:hypothetical protein